MATIVSYKSYPIQTSANTLIPAVIVGARLAAASGSVHLHDPGRSVTTGQIRATSAQTRVLTLTGNASGADESAYPVRIMGGTCVVSPVGAPATLYLFVR